MRILITGSSGLVGGAIAAHLMERGHAVIGLSRQLDRDSRQLPVTISADLGQARAAEALRSVPRCEAIVHAAAALTPDPFGTEISLTNCFGTQQLLALAAAWAVESFVYISGVPVIGRPTTLPVGEEHPTDPPSAYHASKLYGEHLVALAGQHGVPGMTLRLTAPVGPRMPAHRILPVFARRALSAETLEVAGRGTRAQDYVDVRDVAAAVEAVLVQHSTGLLNIAAGRCVSNLELARICVAVLDSSSEITLSGTDDPEEGVRWEVTIARALAAIGYRPQHALEDSITDVAAAMQQGAAVDA